MQTPALRRLRGLFPQAHITLAGRGWAQKLYAGSALFDDFLLHEKAKGFEFLKQIMVWRSKLFDTAILLPNSFESALIARFGNAKEVFGYATDGRKTLLTNHFTVPKWKDERHEVFYYLDLIEQVGAFYNLPAAAAAPDASLQISDERKNAAREFLRSKGVDFKEKIIALGVGSTNSTAKRWGADNFAKLCDLLRSNINANVIILGGSDEIDEAQKVYYSSLFKPIILSGETALDEAAAILSVSDLLVSNDMGLAHIAPSVGTKSLIVFGPTRDETTRPFSENAEIIRAADIECAPCMQRVCPIDHRCMTRLMPEKVFIRAMAILAN